MAVKVPLGVLYSMFFTATRPPAAWKSARAPATRPAFDSNAANSALVQVFEEPFGVSAVVVGDELVDSLLAVSAAGTDFVEASKMSAFDPDAFSVFVG